MANRTVFFGVVGVMVTVSVVEIVILEELEVFLIFDL